ncbi:MAG: putative DNA-binding domain-containing protein [Paracoccaceae bacterium]|nr:MAG: putative DNA-binding domain-containing protein [Paracoccaceae bacterium]
MNAGFTAALLDPARPVPPGLTDPQGRPAGRRFAVYRNNVAVGLTEALIAGFPVLTRLLGQDFFRAMAGVFLRAHPPQSRILADYGQEMPLFLQGFPPVAHLPYLPCTARLELAMRAAYHAADATPLAPGRLAAVPPERLPGLRLRLAPAVRVVRSAWPVHGIWAANMTDAPPPAMRPEDVVILRPDFDPVPALLPPGGAAFLAALMAGETLGSAVERAGEAHDINATIGLLVTGGAITDLEGDRP